MQYSQWLPDKGGYAYYESAERLGLGNDLPTPVLRNTTALGVASTDVGRPLPSGAKFVGYGELARGSIVPFDKSGLSGLTSVNANTLYLGVVATISAFAGFFIVRNVK